MRFSATLLVIILLLLPFHLSAQRGGRRGGGGAGGGGGGAPASGKDQNMKDFDRAMAVQATGDQSETFKSWVSSAESARKQAAAIAGEKENANRSGDLSSEISALRDAVSETQKAQEKFLASFSAKQKSGLKEFTKNLGKADSAVVKALKTLDESSGRKNKEVVGPAEKLEQALTTFQSEQHKLGDEMGIQSTSTTKTAAN